MGGFITVSPNSDSDNEGLVLCDSRLEILRGARAVEKKAAIGRKDWRPFEMIPELPTRRGRSEGRGDGRGGGRGRRNRREGC